jgi:hypothetical protein
LAALGGWLAPLMVGVRRLSRVMTFPALSPNQFAVAQVEVDTGIVLTTDGEHRHLGSGDMYRIFDSLDAARSFARAAVSARPRIECDIYDSEQRPVERITVQS